MSEHIQAHMHEVVRKFLDGGFDGTKWHYTMPDEYSFEGIVSGLSSRISEVRYFIAICEDVVIAHHIAPLKVSKGRRPAVSEFITRANYNLIRGRFEMDFDDGELRYTLPLSQYDLSADDEAVFLNLLRLMMIGANMWERYGDNLAALMMGFADDQNIAVLVQQCEEKE